MMIIAIILAALAQIAYFGLAYLGILPPSLVAHPWPFQAAAAAAAALALIAWARSRRRLLSAAAAAVPVLGAAAFFYFVHVYSAKLPPPPASLAVGRPMPAGVVEPGRRAVVVFYRGHW